LPVPRSSAWIERPSHAPTYTRPRATAGGAFTRTPGSAGNWLGIQFTDTVRDNRLSYAVLEYGRTDDGMVGLTDSSLVIDHCTFANTDRRRIRTENSSLVVRNSTFATLFALGAQPTGDNVCEHIWGSAPTAPGGVFLFENNIFGTTSGHYDAMDVVGNLAGGPVIQILGNTFLGGGDDAMDLEGNAYIEGNTFTHFRKDQWNTGVGNSNVLSAGDAHLVGHDYVFVRNSVYDVDHVVPGRQLEEALDGRGGPPWPATQGVAAEDLVVPDAGEAKLGELEAGREEAIAVLEELGHREIRVAQQL
jgi:hypothetical protein